MLFYGSRADDNIGISLVQDGSEAEQTKNMRIESDKFIKENSDHEITFNREEFYENLEFLAGEKFEVIC